MEYLKHSHRFLLWILMEIQNLLLRLHRPKRFQHFVEAVFLESFIIKACWYFHIYFAGISKLSLENESNFFKTYVDYQSQSFKMSEKTLPKSFWKLEKWIRVDLLHPVRPSSFFLFNFSISLFGSFCWKWNHASGRYFGYQENALTKSPSELKHHK